MISVSQSIQWLWNLVNILAALPLSCLPFSKHHRHLKTKSYGFQTLLELYDQMCYTVLKQVPRPCLANSLMLCNVVSCLLPNSHTASKCKQRYHWLRRLETGSCSVSKTFPLGLFHDRSQNFSHIQLRCVYFNFNYKNPINIFISMHTNNVACAACIMFIVINM